MWVGRKTNIEIEAMLEMEALTGNYNSITQEIISHTIASLFDQSSEMITTSSLIQRLQTLKWLNSEVEECSEEILSLIDNLITNFQEIRENKYFKI